MRGDTHEVGYVIPEKTYPSNDVRSRPYIIAASVSSDTSDTVICQPRGSEFWWGTHYAVCNEQRKMKSRWAESQWAYQPLSTPYKTKSNMAAQNLLVTARTSLMCRWIAKFDLIEKTNQQGLEKTYRAYGWTIWIICIQLASSQISAIGIKHLKKIFKRHHHGKENLLVWYLITA